MLKSTANKRERLITIPVVILLGFIIVVLLVLLFPSQSTFEDQRYIKKPDQLSIAYLKTIYKLRPNNIKLRLILAQQYVSISKWQEAQKLIDEFIVINSENKAQVDFIKVQIYKVKYEYMKQNNPKRQQVLRKAREILKYIDIKQLDKHTLSLLANVALGINRPAVAAKIYKRLAETDINNSTKWWAKAGKWARASGQPKLASLYYLNAYQSSDTEKDGETYAGFFVISSLESKQYELAIKSLKKYLVEFPDNKYFLETIVSAYSLLGNMKKAAQWNKKLWLKHGQNSEEITLRQINLEMSITHLVHAREYAVRLVAINKSNRNYRRRLAQLYEWTSQPINAQKEWEKLVRNASTSYAAEQSLRLAMMNYDEPAIINAIEHIAIKRKLTNKEILEKISSYGRQGKLNSIQVALDEYLRKNPKDKKKWFALAALYENQSNYKSAVSTWGKIEAIFSDETPAAIKQVELYWDYQVHKKAYLKAKSINQDYSRIESMYHLEILSELGWRFNDNEMLRKASTEIIVRDKKNSQAYKRLLKLADEKGDVEQAVILAEAAWKNTGKGTFLRLAIDTAIEEKDRPRVEYLLNLALKNNKNIKDLVDYIVVIAELEDKRKHYQSAAKYYEYAVKLNPHDKAIHVGYLWALLNSHQRQKLKRYLKAFKSNASHSSMYWPVYAAATFEIGEAKESAYWHRRIIALYPEDNIWKLSYADALESAGQFNSAYKIRLYVMNKLRKNNIYTMLSAQPVNSLTKQYLNLEMNLGVGANVNKMVNEIIRKSRYSKNKIPYEFLVAWYGSLKQDDMSRYWHLQQQLSRMNVSDNEKLNFALMENDTFIINNIITRDSEIPPTDRNEGLIRLGLYEAALENSIEGIGLLYSRSERLVSRQQSASLSAVLHNYWTTKFDKNTNGELDISRLNFSTKINVHNWNYGMAVSKNNLYLDSSVVNLNGNNDETEFGFSVMRPGRRFNFLTDIKVNQRGDKNINPVKARLDYQLSSRTNLEFLWEKNQLVDESSQLRTLGMQDKLYIAINSNITSREYINTAISKLKYKSRWGESIASGWRADVNVGHHVTTGINKLVVQFDVNFLKNTLENNLAPQLSQRLPIGSTTSSIAANEFGTVGISLRLNRGEILSTYPQVGSFRYYADAWLGQVYPTNALAYRFSAGFGSRILGNDELSFGFYRDQTANQVNALTSWGVSLNYRSYIGR